MTNPDEARAKATERTRLWRLNNPEKFAAQKLRWQQVSKNKVVITPSKSRKPNESFQDYLGRNWNNLRSRKRCLGFEFTLWPNDLTFPTHCPVLGMELDYTGKNQDNSWSMDRLDSDKGYVPGNVFIISKRANRLKNDGTREEHEKIAKWMNYLDN